jgi:hypothetical protein
VDPVGLHDEARDLGRAQVDSRDGGLTHERRLQAVAGLFPIFQSRHRYRHLTHHVHAPPATGCPGSTASRGLTATISGSRRSIRAKPMIEDSLSLVELIQLNQRGFFVNGR